jgi:plastocyanin
MRRRRFLAVAGAGATTSLAGCTALGSNDGSYDVGMTAVAFDPVEVTVSVGESVVWRNTSSRGHTVTAYGNAIPADAEFFASGDPESEAAAREEWRDDLIDPGESYRHRFEVPGRHEYFCIPHEQAGMVGTVVVEG